ncbi:MAG: 1-deoxy-D-xylulose-5-phosphate reductoisomerase [Chloroflexota bacterium]|jgi:1-deoxy-D-xylulose-5-phosphate reductoisomerase
MTARRRRVAIIGSTGSIGQQTLEVVRWLPESFEVVGLAAGSYSDLFRSQLDEFKPRLAAVGRNAQEAGILPPGILSGTRGLTEVASAPEVDLVVVAAAGRAGLLPTLDAVAAGKTVALANKESLVMAGPLVTAAARRSGARILPIDSEHSAIWQCLRGEGESKEWNSTVRAIILTASGGALRDIPLRALESVTPAQVLAHPTWSMGPKVTVDSATLMNKGLEVIEARWLFDLPLERIQLLLHRESIVHSLVVFVDGSVKAQLGPADMRIPIQYALSYPERKPGLSEPLDLAKIGSLTFEDLDMVRYPCLKLALEAAGQGRSYPAVLSSANEVAVELFLRGDIPFTAIHTLVEEVISKHQPLEIDSIEAVLQVDEWAREESLAYAQNWRSN